MLYAIYASGKEQRNNHHRSLKTSFSTLQWGGVVFVLPGVHYLCEGFKAHLDSFWRKYRLKPPLGSEVAADESFSRNIRFGFGLLFSRSSILK